MDSTSEKIIADLREKNSLLKDEIKEIGMENTILQHKIELLEIHNTKQEDMIKVLMNHKEDQRALVRRIIDEDNEPPIVSKKMKLDNDGDERDVAKDQQGGSI